MCVYVCMNVCFEPMTEPILIIFGIIQNNFKSDIALLIHEIYLNFLEKEGSNL